MKTILRSLFAATPTDPKDLMLQNFQVFLGAGLTFDILEDEVIFAFVREFILTHRHAPGLATLQDHFHRAKEDRITDRLNELSGLPLKLQGDFENYVKGKVAERKLRRISEILKEASTIVGTGIKIDLGKGKTQILQGPEDAVKYVMDQGHDILAPAIGSSLSGEVTRDGKGISENYIRIESDPLAGVGCPTGLAQMDILGGAKRYELWLHAAFTGHLKSTLMLNWAYIQASYFLQSSLIFSLEMPYVQCRNILYAMHSAHDKFKGIRHKLGLQKFPDDQMGLPYRHIRDADLHKWHPKGREFLFNYVIPDFNGKLVVEGEDPYTHRPWPDPKNYGNIQIEVADPDKNDFTMADLRHRAETLYGKIPYRVLFVDHAGLMAPRKWVSSTTDRLNEVMRDLKRLAMSFNRGAGMAVVGMFQINREGFKSAMKRKDKTGEASYDLVHLSYANEAERCVMKSSTYATFPQGKKLVGDARVGDQVWSSTGWQTVLNVFENGVRRIWRLTTDRGSILEGTNKHRVRVLGEGRFEWSALSDLTPLNYAVGTFEGVPWPEKCPELPELTFRKFECPAGRGKGGLELATPGHLTKHLAYLLGAWDGDGKVHPKGLGWTGNRKDMAVRGRLQQAFKDTFGHPLPLQENPSRPGSFDLVKWSQPLKRWFENVAGHRAGEVPECILRASRSNVCAYLQGLFDTDGWINNQGVVGINLKGSCEPFLREIQMLLTALGIDSHLSLGTSVLKKTGKTYPKVLLRIRSREGRKRFLDDIGFTNTGRQKTLVKYTSLDRMKRRGDAQMYPVPQTFLKAYRQVKPLVKEVPRSLFNMPSKVRRTGLVSRGAIECLLGLALTRGLDSVEIRFLRKLLTLQVMRVVSVVDTGVDAPVVDLEVEGDHEYQTGPVLSHNSSDVITASWIDDDLRQSNRVQFQCLKARDEPPFPLFQARVEWPCRRLYTCADMVLPAGRTRNDMKAQGDRVADGIVDSLV